MKRTHIFAAFAAIYTITMTAPAHAYLDPGTGSMLLQALVAGVAVGATTLSLFFGRVKAAFNSILKRHSDDKAQ